MNSSLRFPVTYPPAIESIEDLKLSLTISRNVVRRSSTGLIQSSVKPEYSKGLRYCLARKFAEPCFGFGSWDRWCSCWGSEPSCFWSSEPESTRSRRPKPNKGRSIAFIAVTRPAPAVKSANTVERSCSRDVFWNDRIAHYRFSNRGSFRSLTRSRRQYDRLRAAARCGDDAQLSALRSRDIRRQTQLPTLRRRSLTKLRRKTFSPQRHFAGSSTSDSLAPYVL